MKSSELRQIIKEEIHNVLYEYEEIDYTDRNSGLLDAAKKLPIIKQKLDEVDIENATQKAMESNKNKRLGPVSADWDAAAKRVLDFIEFLAKYDRV